MPTPYGLGLEALVALLFGLCVWHAWRGGLHRVWQLIAGVLFGLLLEWATLQQLHVYHYGRFLFMLGEVPLSVGLAWGVIVYSARLFSDATSLPEWARPVLDGLLALNIDLAVDAVAIRLGMWDWGQGLRWQYFGVPYANFWAWFWVVFSFSFGLRLLAFRADWIGRWLAPAGAIVIGLVGVSGTNALLTVVASRAFYELTIGLMLGAMLALILWLRPRPLRQAPDPLAFLAPLGFHLYFLVAGLISGVILRPPVLLLVTAVMLALAFYLHRGAVPSWLKLSPLPARRG